MEKMLTDEEIVKALEACGGGKGCEVCPYFEKGIDCIRRSEKDTLDLIHRQNAEIERLKNEITYLQGVADAFKGDYKNAKADGVRELLQELIEMEIKLDPLRSGIRYKALIGYAEENGVEVE